MLKKISFALAAIVLSFAGTAYAAGPLSGYAWSSNIGWVSFNSSDGATVQLATSTGALSGYAWSPNVGWIEFGGLSGFPSSGSSATNAAVDLSTGAVTGWARACAGTVNGDCQSASRTDGWDGWIELSGANHASNDQTGNNGVTYIPSTGKFVGYAWGGDVIGWLSFNAGVGLSVNCTGSSCAAGAITASCTPSPASGATPADVTWTTSGVSGGSGAPYTYQWPTYGGTTGGTASSQTYTNVASSYAPSVTVTDNAGHPSVLSCTPFLANTNNPTVNTPTVYIYNPNDPNDYTKTSAHLRANSTLTVGYALPSGDSCILDQSDSGPTLSAWSGTSSTSALVNLQDLQLGVYKLSLDSCMNDGDPATGSNQVEIDVTPSTVQEQ